VIAAADGFSGWAMACAVDAMQAFNERDWRTFESLHHPAVVYTTPISRCEGREAMRRRCEELVAAVPNLRSFDLRFVDATPWCRNADFTYQQIGTFLSDLATPDGVLHARHERFVADTRMTLTFDADGLILAIETRWQLALAA
jgi:hypothetical protein